MADAGNIIAFNSIGISVTGGGSTNVLDGNAVSFNSEGGIDLGADGITPNDPLDADGGNNLLQNYPDLVLAELTESMDLMITYHVDSMPGNATYPLRVGFYIADSAASGEGETLFHFDSFETTDFDNDGKTLNLGQAAALGVAVDVPIVATATDAEGNTSEFSAVFTTVGPPCVLDPAFNAGLLNWLSGTTLFDFVGIVNTSCP